MLEYIVCQKGGGHYTTIQQAVDAVPYGTPALLRIKSGIYQEKLFIEKENLTLLGEGPEETIVTYDDGALAFHADGTPNGTFRSYTAFFGGVKITVKKIRIVNTAPPTQKQAIAAYVDCRCAYFENVHLLSGQDTLFTAPLPPTEFQPGGFTGPRQYTPRLASVQHYKSCIIQGNIDFIFGGADAFFEDCLLHCSGHEGYICAPCAPAGGLGYLFSGCTVTGDSPHTFYLGRPWRAGAKAVFYQCNLGNAVHPNGWCLWQGREQDRPAMFAEGENTGPGAKRQGSLSAPFSALQYTQWRQKFLLLQKQFQPEGDETQF